MPLRQSELEALPQVKKVCTAKVVNTMLVTRSDQRSDWDVFALPPQNEDEMFYRCIFGRRPAGRGVHAASLARR